MPASAPTEDSAPGVRHQRAGVDLFGVVAGEPVHALLHRDGDGGCDQGQQPRLLESGLPRQQVFDARVADEQTADEQHHGEDHGGHTLKPLVAVGVVPVRLLARQLHADDDDDAAEHVRRGVDRVADHGPGVGDDPRQQFKQRQKQIDADAHAGNPHRRRFKISADRFPALRQGFFLFQNSSLRLLFDFRKEGFVGAT